MIETVAGTLFCRKVVTAAVDVDMTSTLREPAAATRILGTNTTTDPQGLDLFSQSICPGNVGINSPKVPPDGE